MLGPYWLALLNACCIGMLMVIKGRARAHGGWTRSRAEGGSIAGCTEVESF